MARSPAGVVLGAHGVTVVPMARLLRFALFILSPLPRRCPSRTERLHQWGASSPFYLGRVFPNDPGERREVSRPFAPDHWLDHREQGSHQQAPVVEANAKAELAASPREILQGKRGEAGRRSLDGATHRDGLHREVIERLPVDHPVVEAIAAVVTMAHQSDPGATVLRGLVFDARRIELPAVSALRVDAIRPDHTPRSGDLGHDLHVGFLAGGVAAGRLPISFDRRREVEDSAPNPPKVGDLFDVLPKTEAPIGEPRPPNERIGEQRVRPDPRPGTDLVLQEPVHRDDICPHELGAGWRFLRQVWAIVRNELQVEIRNRLTRCTRARRVDRHLLQPNPEGRVANLHDVDEPLRILHGAVGGEDEDGIALEFHEAKWGGKLLNKEAGDLREDTLRVDEVVLGDEGGVARNVGNNEEPGWRSIPGSSRHHCAGFPVVER